MMHFWIGFHLLLALLLALDFYFFRRQGELSLKKAWCLSGFWITAALLFNTGIYFLLGKTAALEFFTGYLIEKSLSLDNLFVFTLIFAQFHLSATSRSTLLFWGMGGVIVLRISLILAGISLMSAFHFLFYLLGAFLLLSGVRFLLAKRRAKDPIQAFLFRHFKRFLPLASTSPEGKFFVKEKGSFKVTTLFLALLIVECADVIFALDSIPAVFAITTDPFIVYTSNVFAILGLRALHCIVADSLDRLKYFKWGLGAILIFVGGKMLLSDLVQISLTHSLLVILTLLGLVILFSRQKQRA